MDRVLQIGIEVINLFFLFSLLVYLKDQYKDEGRFSGRSGAVIRGLFFALIGLAIKAIWFFGLLKAYGTPLSDLFSFSMKRVIYLFSSGFTLAVLALFLGTNRSMDQAKSPLVLFVVLQLILIALFCITVFALTKGTAGVIWPWISLFLILMLSVLILSFYSYITNLFRKELETQRLLSRQEDTEKRMSEVTSLYSSLHMLRHDLKRQIQTAGQMLDKEEGKRYLEEIEDSMFELFSTGCLPMDALLTVQAMQMKQKRIVFDHDLCSLGGLPINDADLCSIVGNLLENAMEAAEKLEILDLSEQPVVLLRIRKLRDMLFITCKNPYNKQAVHYENGLFLTDKKGPNHGQGMKIIDKLAKDNRGTFTADAKDGVFTATVMVPAKNR